MWLQKKGLNAKKYILCILSSAPVTSRHGTESEP